MDLPVWAFLLSLTRCSQHYRLCCLHQTGTNSTDGMVEVGNGTLEPIEAPGFCGSNSNPSYHRWDPNKI